MKINKDGNVVEELVLGSLEELLASKKRKIKILKEKLEALKKEVKDLSDLEG